MSPRIFQSTRSYNPAQDSSHVTFTPSNALNISCYIVNLLTGTRIPFVSMPDTVQETLNTIMNQVPIQGRSDPLFYYSSSGPRSVTFTIPIYDDLTPYGIVPMIDSIRALVYPSYTGYVVNPPRVYLSLGRFVSLIGFTENVGVEWFPTPINDSTFQYANVSFTFSQATIMPYDALQVQQGVLSHATSIS